MGLNISSVSLSCIDCKSRLNTIEDFENSWKLQSKEFNFHDDSLDSNDEFTVFRTQPKEHSIDDISNFSQILPKSDQSMASDIQPTSPESRLQTLSLRASTLYVNTKHQDDQSYSEIFTPSTIRKNSRVRTYSRNYSKVSNNIVETIRKING